MMVCPFYALIFPRALTHAPTLHLLSLLPVSFSLFAFRVNLSRSSNTLPRFSLFPRLIPPASLLGQGDRTTSPAFVFTFRISELPKPSSLSTSTAINLRSEIDRFELRICAGASHFHIQVPTSISNLVPYPETARFVVSLLLVSTTS